MEPGYILPIGPGPLAIDSACVRRRLMDLALDGVAPFGRVRGDHDLNPDMYPDAPLKPAAVLVPLVERDMGLTVLFTQRAANLADHAGQISFPGGRLEKHDADAEAAALRETEEEIGLPRKQVEVIGRLDTYITRTRYQVTPVVGLIRPPFELRPDPIEVAEVFEVPLDFILDPASPVQQSREFMGRQRFFYAFPYGDRYIWGATAGMLLNLSEVLNGSC